VPRGNLPRWDWSIWEDGALALAPRAPRLQDSRTSVTVPAMPAPRSRRRHTGRRRREAVAARRARRIAALVTLAAVALVTLLLTAFGSGQRASVVAAGPAPADRLLPVGPPRPEVISQVGSLLVSMPVPQSRVTAIGYHGADATALALTPRGSQANAGFLRRLLRHIGGGGGGSLRYYQISGGQGSATGELDIGAPTGTDVYSPVDGTVIGVSPYVIDQQAYGSRIDIQPSGAPNVVLSLTHVRVDPSLAVGSPVSATSSKLGTVIDLSGVERQALARYSGDAGNHVALQAHAAAIDQ